jgi:membrane protease YdiL (CAAX protease family)
MKKLATILKPLMPVLAAAYGLGIIYLTALPMADGDESLGSQVLCWIITLGAIALTFFIVKRVEPKVFPEARQFSMKWPIFPVVAGLLLMTPLWVVVKEYIVYGFTSLIDTVRLEPIAFTPDEIREDLLASVHAVLLAPVLEELCYRQLAISPFRRRGAQIAVCMVMAVLFGILHVRNFFGSFLAATLFGLVFVWSRNIWYAVLLHAGSNLTATLVGVYCVFGLGEVQMSKIPVIFMPDAKFAVASVVLAIAGLFLLKRKQSQKLGTLNTESLT